MKYMGLILLIFFFLHQEISMASRLKKTNFKLDLLSDNDMLLIVEKGITDGICHAIY